MGSQNFKVIVLDLDGVVSTGRYFSQIYADEQGVDINKLTPFFKNKKDLANMGQDLKVLLKDELENWEWKGTVDELVDYWLKVNTDVDTRFNALNNKLRAQGIKVYLATDQEKYRMEYLWNVKDLKDWFDGLFVSYEVGAVKDEPEFFAIVIKKLGVTPEDILYIDDSSSKIAAAAKNGVKTMLYKNFEQLEKDLS